MEEVVKFVSKLKDPEGHLKWRRWHKSINKEKLRQQDRDYAAKNRERINSKKRERHSKNPERARQYAKNHRAKYPEEVKVRIKRWAAANKERRLIYQREYVKTQKFKAYANSRYKNDLNFRIKTILRSRLYVALKGKCKSAKTLTLLGCEIEFLKNHIQSQFLEGMSWNNFGQWEIDHRVPCAKFNLLDPGQQLQCFNWKNLQPMWMPENRRKKDKMIYG